MQQLPPPMEADKAWEKMKVLLDKELPRGAGSGGNGRWWIIGLVAGILLTGTWFLSRNNSGDAGAAKQPTAVDRTPNAADQDQQSIANLPSMQHPPGAASKPAAKDAAEKPAGKQNSKTNTDAARTDRAIVTAKDQTIIDEENTTIDEDVGITVMPPRKNKNQHKLPAYTENSTQQTNHKKENSGKENDPVTPVSSAHTNADIKPKSLSAVNSAGNPSSETLTASIPDELTAQPLLIETDQLVPGNKIDHRYANKRSPQTRLIVSAKNQAPKKAPRKSDFRDRKFAIGLSLPLAFPLADQQALGYNFRGGPNTVSDYLPSPHMQYHLNKRTFFQTELQVVAPQFIRPILIYQEKNMMSGNAWLYNSVYARKLYYFNLPVSVYHSPLPNFFLGTGLQFSSLMSGVAMYEDKKVYGNQETILSQSFNRINHDSLTNRMSASEIRLLLDVNYYWQRFTVGLRYNQAFGNYASFRLNNTTGYTYDKNKALFFYLRYNIWEDKKRNQPARSMLTLK